MRKMTENQLRVYKELLQKNIDTLQESYENTKDERFRAQMMGYKMALKDLEYVVSVDFWK